MAESLPSFYEDSEGNEWQIVQAMFERHNDFFWMVSDPIIRGGFEYRAAFFREASDCNENAVYAKQVLHPGPGETWVLVTSAYHMPRSVGSFEAAGWKVIPYPVDYKTDPITGLRPNFSLLDGLGTSTLAGGPNFTRVGKPQANNRSKR